MGKYNHDGIAYTDTDEELKIQKDVSDAWIQLIRFENLEQFELTKIKIRLLHIQLIGKVNLKLFRLQ